MKTKKIKMALLACFMLVGLASASYATGCLECINSSNDGHCYNDSCSKSNSLGAICCGNHI
jgi:hypothetical protein